MYTPQGKSKREAQAGRRVSAKGKKRLPPVRIPLSFDDAVGGLLAVKPKKKAPTKKNG